MNDYQIILTYGESGQTTYNNFKNKVAYLTDLTLNQAEDFVNKFNQGLGIDFKPYCPMRYEVIQKSLKR